MHPSAGTITTAVRGSGIVGLGILLLLAGGTAGAQTSANSSAYGLESTLSFAPIVGLPIDLSAGPTPTASGSGTVAYSDSDTLASISVGAMPEPGTIVSTGALTVNASSILPTEQADADATVLSVALAVLGSQMSAARILELTADSVSSTAQVTADCSGPSFVATGTTTLVNPVASSLGSGLSISSTPSANTILLDVLGVITVTLNEQILSGDGVTSRGITVNAIHVSVSLSVPLVGSLTGDVILGQSQAELMCAAPTETPTVTPTDTPSMTPTDTPTDTPTSTQTETATPSETPTTTGTPTGTPSTTPTGTSTSTPTETATPSETPTSTATATPSDTPTASPSGTPTSTETPTSTPSASPSATGTSTATPSQTPTATGTTTHTGTATPTLTPTATPSATGTASATRTPTTTPTATFTPTTTPTRTTTATPTPIAPTFDGGVEPGEDVIRGQGAPNRPNGAILVCLIGGATVMPSTPPCTAPDSVIGSCGTDAGGQFVSGGVPGCPLSRPLELRECVYPYDTVSMLVGPIVCAVSPAPAPALSLGTLGVGLALLVFIAGYAMRVRP